MAIMKEMIRNNLYMAYTVLKVINFLFLNEIYLPFIGRIDIVKIPF